MVLGFKHTFPETMRIHHGERSSFPEAVLSSQFGSPEEIPEKFRLEEGDDRIAYWKVGRIRPKIHTFRKPSGRRKPGAKLHPTLSPRTKESFQFCPELELISKQKLSIEYRRDKNNRTVVVLTIDGSLFGWIRVSGSLIIHCTPEVKELIINDGFSNANAFIAWFNESGEYDILHWTDKEYEGKCNDLPELL